MYVYMHVCHVCRCTYVCMYVCTYVCIYVCLFVFDREYVCLHVCMTLYTHTYIYIHIDVCTHFYRPCLDMKQRSSLELTFTRSLPGSDDSSDSDFDDLAEELFVGFEQGDPRLILGWLSLDPQTYTPTFATLANARKQNIICQPGVQALT